MLCGGGCLLGSNVGTWTYGAAMESLSSVGLRAGSASEKAEY